MIRIEKGGFDVPDILTVQGGAERDTDIEEYEQAPAGYSLNTRQRTKFGFKREIYGADEVKSQLKAIQQDKCCFCEAKITHIANGDIEHFRPKAAYKQDEESQIRYPGYFWLAYEWDNLYLSCEICNQRYKQNLFPLFVEANRAQPITRDIILEEPVFIDPGHDNPEEHIGFIGPDPTPKNQSLRGLKTIQYLGLDREELVEHRRSKLNLIKALQELVELSKNTDSAESCSNKFQDVLRNAISQEAEYSSMIKCNFENYITGL